MNQAVHRRPDDGFPDVAARRNGIRSVHAGGHRPIHGALDLKRHNPSNEVEGGG
jgi:hypothetical protein